MPLSRYQIRNEFSLADPELYKTADKDDPEALLEGVAMAGLVGVLRQLGNLSEFAAEVFHNLHEEVMATAARGYNLRDRVQQLEVEFPFIEKAFLSQTNHSDFFYTAGVDWHLNTRMDRNYITREDLPRFIMDSYEEARGPPRLFLLDKYDVSGDGACLKRYTDPSFYSVEAAALGITNADVQRDKKVRKGKRRASRWRNGETPDIIPTPHAKLHQLLLEERIANSAGDPARRVKLKRRLNGFPFDLKTSKSYMEQILTPPPEYSQLHEVCYSSPLKLLEMDDIASEGLDVELMHRSPSMSPDFKEGVRDVHLTEMESETSNESDCFNPKFVKDEVGLKNPSLQLIHTSSSVTPDTKDSVQNISIDEQESEAFGIESREFPKANGSLEGDYVTSTLYEDVVEKQIMVDKEGKSELSTSYQSDDVASEVENYIDALATMELELELEMETDSELHVPSVRNQIAGLDAASPSDFQSDDGSSSSKKCKSDPLYSCSPRILAKEPHMDAEVSDDIYTSNGTGKVKSISSPLKWRGRTRNLGGRKVTPIPTYSSDDIEKTSSNTDISPGFFVHRDADASAGENEVSQLTSGMLPAEGTEPINATESESNASLDVPCDATSSATPLQTKYHSSSRVSVETHSSDNGEDSHLMEHSSSKPSTSDDTCITGGSKDQHMEEVVDKHIYLLPDVTPASCILDGAPLDSEENLSSSHNDNQRMSEHPSNALPQELFENGLHEDFPNDESGAREVLGVLYRASVHPSTCIVDTAEEEMSESSVQNMPQAGDRENDFVMHPVVNQIDLQVTSMPPEEEQTMEPRLPELENINKAISTQYLNLTTNDNLVKPVSPPTEVAVEEIPTSPFQRDLCSENLRVSGMTDILQPLDPVDSSMDSQIEEQFPDMSDEQSHVTSLSETEICSDAADFSVTIPGESVATPPAGEIAVDMEDQALSGILKGDDTRDILEAQVVLDSVPQPAVKTSDNGDEICHELPSLSDRVETDSAPAGETVIGTESLIVKPEICALNEMHASVTADDMLLHNKATVETSPNQIINLHELAKLAAEKLEGVASSTNLDERSTTDCDSVAENAYTSNAIVKGGGVDSNQYGLDVGVPFSVTYGESGTEEKNNIQKVALQLMSYDHSESIIPEKLSNSSSESESSLNTDIRGSSTLEHNEFHMNGVRADDDTIMPIYTSPEERKVNFPLHQLDEEETEVFRNPGEPHMLSNSTRDPSVLEQSESSSKWVHCEKSVLTVYNQDASPIPIDHDGEEQKVTISDRLDEGENQVFAVAGQSDVMLEPQLVEETKSNLLGQEGISGIASIHSELLPQEKPAMDDVGQYHNSLGSVPPVFGSLSEEVHTDPVEIPPLPPLPPVQWRMGKNQETVVPKNIFFPSMSLFTTDQEADTDNINLSAHADATENSLLTYESMSETLVQDPPSSLLTANHANIIHLQALGEAQLEDPKLPFPGSNSNHLSLGESQSLDTDLSLSENGADLVVTEFYSPSQNSLLPANNKFPSINETQSLSQNLPLPANFDEMPRHDDHTSTSSNAYSSGTNGDGGAAAACDDELVVDSATLAQFNQAQATSQNKILDQGSASSENGSNRDTSGHEKKIENERPHVMMLGLEGEVMWAVQDEGRPYGVRPMKLPRQRNPLIDAVIAVDKSKLRKVTEQPKPRMKADNRDSELENLQLRRVTEQTRTQIQKADERDSVFENLQLRKVTEQPRIQIQKADERDSAFENLQLRKVTEQPRTPVQKADGRDSAFENLQLRKVTEQPRTQIQKADGRDSSLEKLRKVTEQPSSQMQSADERDSLLEQIRAKTFHLKPTVVSKPAVQGPTNLKVAAILEKAKTIRQAFAGSDEDDDDDSWSDS